VVPCGKPVPSSVRASELLYNEYIVYNTAQVGFTFNYVPVALHLVDFNLLHKYMILFAVFDVSLQSN